MVQAQGRESFPNGVLISEEHDGAVTLGQGLGGVRKDSLEAGHPTSGWLVDGGLSTPSSVRGRQLEPRLQDHPEKPGH